MNDRFYVGEKSSKLDSIAMKTISIETQKRERKKRRKKAEKERETNKQKTLKTIEQSTSEKWDDFKQLNTSVTGDLKESKQGELKILKEIMAQKLSNFK